jgi:endoglucanase
MRSTGRQPIGRLARILLATTLTVAAGAVVTAVGIHAASAAPQATGEFNYAEALQDSMLFYEIQRSGKLPADNRVSWRGDSDLTDGSDVGLDLTGGYHDAGDEVKFGLPAAYSMATLAWGGIANSAGYTKSGQMTYLLRNLRWGDDYIMKAHPSAHVFYAQVGTGAADHTFWGPAEVNPTTRQSFAVTESCPGSDVVGQSAAALAASSILFKSTDATYAATLLTQAKSLYEFADDFRGTYDACIPDVTTFYKSWSGYWDELVWGAIWLYKATGDQTYLTKATSYYANLGKMNQSTTPKYNYTMSWDDNTFGDYILMAEITGQQQYIDDAERNLDWLTVGYGGTKPTYTPGGEVQVDTWGPARYAANAAFTALEFSNWLKSQGQDATRQKTYHDFALQQVNYILGDNPNKESYEIGFTNSGTSTKWPQNPHHRTAHGSWDQSMTDPTNTRHTAYGLLVGGPTSGTDSFTDDRQQYQQTEGALDYNSLFSGVVAGFAGEYGGTPVANFPAKESPDGAEIYSAASINQAGTNFIEIKSQVYNKSGWPARDLTNGHLRYYFTLDSGVSASQVTASFVYHECGTVSIKQFSGSTYYADIDCTGQHIAPAGQSAWHRENQFRITFPAAHDYTKDWSFTGVGAAGTTPVTVNNIAVYDGTTKIWGNEPGTGTVTNPPSAPGTPVASAVTSSGATLTWTAATAGTNPIAGYDVYRVGTTDTLVASTTGALTTALTGLTASTTYQFYVVARDSAGNVGSHSTSVSVTTSAGSTTPPGAPGTPVASNVTSTGATLTWTAATAGSNAIAGYNVYRVGSTDTLVASTTGALTTAITGLTASTTYQFSVAAKDSAGTVGAHSANVSVTTTAGSTTPPGAPGTPVASNVTSTGATLTWTAATAGTNPIGKYLVYQAGTSSNTLVGSTLNGSTTSLTLTGLTPSTTYSFFVVAQDSTGVSGTASAKVSVTTSQQTSTASCQVTYSVNDWGGGFTAAITIKNTGTTTINGWTLAFSYAGNQTISQGWSATWTQTGKNITATALSWNATLAPGASTGIGFNASYTGSNAAPTAFTLNGAACTS